MTDTRTFLRLPPEEERAALAELRELLQAHAERTEIDPGARLSVLGGLEFSGLRVDAGLDRPELLDRLQREQRALLEPDLDWRRLPLPPRSEWPRPAWVLALLPDVIVSLETTPAALSLDEHPAHDLEHDEHHNPGALAPEERNG